MATGLAYPVKAERARRNPKVGLLYFPTEANEPVVQIVGIASVRDSNIQQNMLTYLAETGYILPEIPWEIKRQAIWYWARILIEVRPRQVLWWDSADLLDQPPNRWDAPANSDYPPSDPSPSGSPSAAPNWGQPAWREMAQTDVRAQYPAHLTTIDKEGFPRIMRARRVQLTNDGFQIDLPHGTPGLQVGSATLTYFGRDTFVGTIHGERGTVSMSVERALPILPTMGNPSLLWNPTVAYLFRMRQLYVAVPKLFRHAQISRDGSLCELLVYNKGNQAEEDIQVNLDPELKGELLASSSNDIVLNGATLKIERLHKGTEASAVLLIENGVLDASKIISVSSKGAKGKVLKKANEIPPNFAKAFLLFFAYVVFFPTLYYGESAYHQVKAAYVESQLEASYKLGWKDLDRYFDSDLKKSYSNQEFPIHFIRQVIGKDKRVFLEFEVYNKTALPLEVFANRKNSEPGDISHFASTEVPAMSKAMLSVPKPDVTGGPEHAELSFNFKFGDEYVHSIIYVASSK